MRPTIIRAYVNGQYFTFPGDPNFSRIGNYSQLFLFRKTPRKAAKSLGLHFARVRRGLVDGPAAAVAHSCAAGAGLSGFAGGRARGQGTGSTGRAERAKRQGMPSRRWVPQGSLMMFDGCLFLLRTSSSSENNGSIIHPNCFTSFLEASALEEDRQIVEDLRRAKAWSRVWVLDSLFELF